MAQRVKAKSGQKKGDSPLEEEGQSPFLQPLKLTPLRCRRDGSPGSVAKGWGLRKDRGSSASSSVRGSAARRAVSPRVALRIRNGTARQTARKRCADQKRS